MTSSDLNNPAAKAAILLLAMGGSTGSALLKEFSPDDIRAFADTASTIDRVDPSILDDLIAEFTEEMDRPAPLIGGDVSARTLLNEALPAEDVEKALGNRGAPFVPVWDKFQAGAENMLVPYLLDEHPQTVAFIISRLDPALSARVIALLPTEMRDSVARRLLKMAPVNEAISRMAQDALRQDLLADASNDIASEGRTRMASLLNRMERQQVDDIITSLRRERPEEADALKKMLFSFEDLPRLEQKHRLVLFDKVQTEQVMLALRGAEGDLKELVLSSLGARARRMIEAELQGASQEVTAEVTAARQAIAQMTLNLAANGDIVIRDDAAPAGAAS